MLVIDLRRLRMNAHLLTFSTHSPVLPNAQCPMQDVTFALDYPVFPTGSLRY